MRLHAKISSQFDQSGLMEFDVLPGAVYTETYNEELDSGSIIIAHQTRRMANIAPYDWVRIYDEDGTFARTMLVDDFVESRPNIYEPIYDYAINLMSETKLLEKIQLPNRQWQHSLTGERKTLRQAIAELCESYIPKVKTASGGSWGWSYVIDFGDFADPSSEAYSKFDVPTADISLSQPTLRQAISAFMTQVGCIPTVRDGKLGWLDLRAEPRTLTIAGDSFAQTQRSNASDSYVSELVSQGENILDSENSSVSETLGFRDRGKVFLKQTENLYLETRYPIYKVTKLAMNSWMQVSAHLGLFVRETDTTPNVGYYRGVEEVSRNMGVKFLNFTQPMATPETMHLENAFFVYGSRGSDGLFRAMRKMELGNFQIEDGEEHICYASTSVAEENAFTFAAYWAEREKWIVAFSWMNIATGTYDNYGYYSIDEIVDILYKKDITPLCVENGKRSQLDTDFMAMTDSAISSVEDLAEWVYGTVGYSVGGKTIEGWSSTYTYLPNDSWWAAYSGERTVTYIENISNKLIKNDPTGDAVDLKKMQISLFGEDTKDLPLIDEDHFEAYDHTSIGVSTNNFANWFFDVEYQPLNSLSVRYSKTNREIPLPLQQLDTSANAISSMDAMSANETDLANRLGNDVTSLSQYADDDHLDEIAWFDGAPLRVGDDIVFQIVHSFDLNGSAANYLMSESAVMRNYFTGVQTKYRAYQYVGYDQAVVRKENVKTYVLISESDYPNMTQKVWFGATNHEGYVESSRIGLLSPFDDDESYDKLRITAGYQGNSLQTFKNECSVITYGSSIILNQEEFDNVSAGLAILKDSEYNDIGGGIPQKWHMWIEAQEPYERRLVGWMSDISELYEAKPINPTAEELEATLGYIANMPSIREITDIPLSTDNRISYDPAIISIADLGNNRTDMPLYKDYSELLNVSLQMEYYTDSPDIEFGEWLSDMVCWKGGNRPGGWEKTILAGNGDRYVPSACLETDPDDMTVSIINVPAGDDEIRLGLWKNGEFRLGIAFRNARVGQKYRIRLNDTKTVRAYLTDDETGIKYLGYLIQPNAGL